MADYTLTTEANGIYEIPITANQTVTVDVAGRNSLYAFELQITVHSGNAPLYAKVGNTVEARDPHAQMFPAGSFGTIYGTETNGGTIAFTSAAECIFSVARS
jgi:hypothetical protein